MKTVIIATENKGKIKEFKELFAEKGIEVQSLLDLSFPDEIEETGSTFEENAIIKAAALADYYQKPVIADDSGLEIDALDGEPGVYSARYAGGAKNDDANMEKVLENLKGVEESDRTARFVCVIAVVIPGQNPFTYRGTCEGLIANGKTGTNGFGYDPIFYLPEYKKTMAQLLSEEKNRISHRANAIKQLMTNIDEVIG
ncbi:non-canonical purine NTP pyrophosphatase [Lottiidibacillus patelloidae]|uniref:dITP/XTP pyrophosphatase n=1 Tax=Lottiidibacillus patelloidae TaxID=2670334 RepID=A0A263BW02_9BACI|nr:XTP/dITP diphosphatase [Lottiidibacillus patelloidae]OZM57894.1 non-canonical purine NTP pyrophosphatase [Lottiidibacillus patelloidae]